MNARPRALLLYGGWEGHKPEEAAQFAESELLQGFEVEKCQDLSVLASPELLTFDLLLPIWTFGEITSAEEQGLLQAVASGVGLLNWHGATSAFLASRAHKHLIGAQFVAHPGGEGVTYAVDFLPHSLTEGLGSFSITTEQYYFLLDPAIEILATTRMVADGDMPWLADVSMPVAWTRQWGSGRVFYSAIGHTVADLQVPQIKTLLRRAVKWAAGAGTTEPRLALRSQ